MIEAKQVSVVVQGPIVAHDDLGAGVASTRSCLKSIREHLPGAEVILSTWKNSDLAGLDYDVLVESDDPGGLLETYQIRYNVNRQIRSTSRGLQVCTRDYAIKMRTDSQLLHHGFLNLMNPKACRNRRYRVFEERVIISDLFARTPHREPHPLLFHPADTFQFGLSTDLKRLWGVPFAAAADVCSLARPKVPLAAKWFARDHLVYDEEQYVWITCLREAGFDFALRYSNELSFRKIVASEQALIANFCPYHSSELGVSLPQRFQENGPTSVYTTEDFVYLSNLFGDSGDFSPRVSLHFLKMRLKSGWYAKVLRKLSLL